MHNWADILISFAIGLLVGNFVGMMITALVSANGKDGDE